MKANYITIFLILSSLITRKADSKFPDEEKNRRILHQPLFPASSTPPPPQSELPPPLHSNPDVPGQDQPFFHELPNGPTSDQNQQTPPQPSTTTTPVENSVATKPSNPTKKIAIGITSAVLILAMVSALAFYTYKRRSKHQDESQKLVGRNSQRNNDESRMPQSTFLYIGTVEPSTRSIASETNGGANGSPYRKLNSGKRSDRYRPSPDLQPLPPLPKPPPPPSINSPPPMSSSDDESHDTNFYTPQGSSMSNESPGSRHSYLNNRAENRVPHSKRTSPKSRVSASSPDIKPVIIPSIKKPPPPSPPPPPPPPPAATSSLGPLQMSKTISYTPKRPKFHAPPPPLDMAKLRSISNDDQQTRKTPIPTPPPPPPPPPAAHLSIPRKFGSVEPYTPSPVSKQMIRPQQSKSPSPKANPGIENTISPIDEANKGVSSSEKVDREDRDGSKPKLKPLHWDKVRATSERATVWDQLNSSSCRLNEDAMESLFGCNSATSVPKEANRKSAIPPGE